MPDSRASTTNDNFGILTNDDKQKLAYYGCVSASAGIGAAVGAAEGVGFGFIPGGIVGLVIGLVTCPHITEPIKRKFLRTEADLSDAEVLATLRVIRQREPKISKGDAILRLAQVHHEIRRNPEMYRRFLT